MEKLCNVVMLSTNEKSNLFIVNKEILTYSKSKCSNDSLTECMNLYITSNDEIKEGDWVIYTKGIKIHYKQIFDKCDIELANIDNSGVGKIIATTNKALINDGFRSDTKTLMAEIPQQFIEHYVSEYNKGNVITEIRVEFEEISNSHLFIGFDKKYPNYFKLKLNQDNTINIKPVKDSWNREEVYNLMMQSWINGEAKPNQHYSVRENWIKQNLN